MTSSLKAAIDRSISHNEIVRVEYAGDASTLVVDLATLYDGEIDDAVENDGAIDVWGYTDGMPDGQMDWRLRVTLTD